MLKISTYEEYEIIELDDEVVLIDSGRIVGVFYFTKKREIFDFVVCSSYCLKHHKIYLEILSKFDFII